MQPGGRPPAPGDLALVQAFINSHYDLEVEHGAELLATPAALARWLARRGLIGARATAGQADLERALDAREGLRVLASANGDARGAPSDGLPRLDRAARGAPVELRIQA